MEINVYSVDRDDGAYLLCGDSDAGTREARVRSGIPRKNPAAFKLMWYVMHYSEWSTLIIARQQGLSVRLNSWFILLILFLEMRY